MQALRLTTYEGPQALELCEVPEPSPGPSEVLLEIGAIGINFPDLLITTGTYQHKPEVPFVPGCEVAGKVLSAPDDSGWQVGDRVAAFIWAGSYAERAVVPLNALMRLPEGTDFATGAGMVVNYHTAHFALIRRGHLRPGETVLVLGAAGGIGTAAVQIAKGNGANVIGGVADESQLETAKKAGADHAIVLEHGFATQVRELSGGRGVDIVLDPLGSWLFLEGVRALEPEGRILVVGFAAGEIPEIKVNRLLLRNVAAVGVAWGAFLDVDPTMMATTAVDLASLLARGYVSRDLIARCKFEQIPETLERLSRGEIRGKVVATPPAG
ncbi:NADPH:quinone oxidoreductase family protein [Conexibacter sp. DBS9H8]|uniref:NADPH:quinone oxidoreductase family protein n=1 Tax=Conexibacter sp. DBS9H8 TaxID=2937801 RepID=UPI00200F504C|nr:NADPH:quinone oxidoreductase family protein [Conexibacter sp. DBS9H8]